MKLPPHIIKSVQWFEHYSEEGSSTWGDRFVLHFRQWWKGDKTIWIDGVFAHKDIPSGRHLFRRSSSAEELLAQLKEQCKDQA